MWVFIKYNQRTQTLRKEGVSNSSRNEKRKKQEKQNNQDAKW
jgi:hypothetical protein